MAISDARRSKSLERAFTKLGETQSVQEFLDSVPDLDLGDRERIVDQAIVLVKDLYAHLPLKRARHAVDPVQRLELIRHRLRDMSETALQMEMVETFKELRDAHTNYGLPRPYAGRVAFLPFLMEDFFEDGQRRFVATHLLFGFTHSRFEAGVEITHWNGTPVERAVRLNADREEGSNDAARFAFGLAAMTVRFLGSSLPPDEEWVVVGYRDQAGDAEILLPWRIWDRATDPAPDLGSDGGVVGLAAAARGAESLHERVFQTHRARKRLFSRKAAEAEERMGEVSRALRASARAMGSTDVSDLDLGDADADSLLPDVFQFAVFENFGKAFGYVRIRTFSHDVNQFVNEFLRILELMPGDGLILDVRSNGGGIILNGELLLQLFTPERITPEPFQFINTPLTRTLTTEPAGGVPPDIAEWRAELAADWGTSIAESIETGAVFSRGVPLTPPDVANVLGQRYHGPVLLVTDAQCYSTTDIFAAGFQDHEIGPILGIDRNTGAGGANVWEHGRHLVPLLPGSGSPIQALPAGTTMRVAIRRSTRVKENTGQPLEDLGVKPDHLHQLTRADVFEDDIDLITRATEILNERPVRRLDVEVDAIEAAGLVLRVHTAGIERVDCYVDGRPMFTASVEEDENKLDVPTEGGPPAELEIQGFEGEERVAARRIALGP